jgi:hypothetical protein
VSIAGDIWLHCVAVILLLSTIAIGVWQLVAGAKALSPLLISVLWAVYAIIPPFLLVRVPAPNSSVATIDFQETKLLPRTAACCASTVGRAMPSAHVQPAAHHWAASGLLVTDMLSKTH